MDCYAGIMLSDWLQLVTRLVAANQNALFQHSVGMLLYIICLCHRLPRPNHIKRFLCMFYDTQFFKHSDWLKTLSIQSDCLKTSIENTYAKLSL